MTKKIKKTCHYHNEHTFYVEPGEEWKALCPSCYKHYYLPMKHKYSYSDMKKFREQIISEVDGHLD